METEYDFESLEDHAELCHAIRERAASPFANGRLFVCDECGSPSMVEYLCRPANSPTAEEEDHDHYSCGACDNENCDPTVFSSHEDEECACEGGGYVTMPDYLDGRRPGLVIPCPFHPAFTN